MKQNRFKKYFFLKNYINYLNYSLSQKYKKSYSQCGEDLLIECALKTLKINKPSYIDIGTNHPVHGNNTFLFYQKGSKGICVEPNPEVFRVIEYTRKRDICLNAGIGTSDNESVNFYVMSSRALSTFIKSEADKYVNENNYGVQNIEKIIKIPVIAINSIMRKYFPSGVDVVSLDTEGYDFEILKSFDLENIRPKVFCVETLRYEANGELRKQKEIISYLAESGYFLYADTYVNSIFIDKKAWPL